MKSRLTLRMGAMAAMLLAMGQAGIAEAHTQRGALNQKAASSATYRITCLNPGNGLPTRLDVAIQDLKPVKPPLLIVTAQWGDGSVSSTDTKDGDVLASPLVSADGGAITYTVTVGKTVKPGKSAKTLKYPEIFTLTYHCITGTEHTETELTIIKRQ